MINLKKGAALSVVAAMTLAGFVGASASAYATTEPMKTDIKKHRRMAMHPLTVRRTAAAHSGLNGPGPTPVTAVTGVAAAVINPVTGLASSVVAMPFTALGGIFPAGGPRSGGVTAVRYAGAGPEADKIDEGFAQPVPVDKSGPIFVVENGDPTINPLSLIGAPISVAGQLIQTPFKIIGATGL